MSTTAVNSNQSSQPYDASLVGQKTAQALSQEDFLQLLAVQFKQQDPFNPTSDTEFMAQMAQFSALEQMSELNREFSQLRAENRFATGSGLIGKNVIVADESGQLYEGTVDGLQKTSSGYLVEVGGALFPISSVQHISQPAAEAPASGAAE